MSWTSLPARIDAYPTHRIGGFEVRAGQPLPFGATPVPGGVNFSVYSNNATAMTLVLFRAGADEPLAELPFDESFRIGGVYAMTVFGLDPEAIAYAYRADGPFAPAEGDRFDGRALLVDPYATLLSGRERWRCGPDRPWRSRIAPADFDWEGDRPLRIPAEDLVVYEAHVRGFTAHPSSGVGAPGTFAGLVAKIPYLVELGVNCVELMPVFEFDERDNVRADPRTGEPLANYWGYSTVGFFAPKAGYAATGRHGMQVDEFKHTVKELHRAGIEVMLDVVFNHTAEGDERGPTLSLRGLDNRTYYMLTPDGHYFNFSGTGNTLNCNHPVVRGFVLDCLRYWASEFHVDGFRFDLAAILGRATDGVPLANPPLLEALAHDPVLRDCKLVAEVWDAGGLFQVGSFPDYCRWAEWNAGYRDALRHFLKGDVGSVAELATRFVGSPDLYARRGAVASVNFVTAHDGFTLRDLVSYNEKHNDANGEDGRDGENHNISWNCGHEGPVDGGPVARLRDRQVRNALLILLTSHGIPMLLAGDEAGRQHRDAVAADPAHQPRHPDAAGRRRSRPDPARQQQRLLPRRRAVLVRLDAGRAQRRAGPVHPAPDRLPPRAPVPAAAPPAHRAHPGPVPGRQLARRARVDAGLVAAQPRVRRDAVRARPGRRRRLRLRGRQRALGAARAAVARAAAGADLAPVRRHRRRAGRGQPRARHRTTPAPAGLGPAGPAVVRGAARPAGPGRGATARGVIHR
ncbi:glycogen debranching protein GlgX [Amycolatopsis vancoresmycina DSM 44592]|uniref:Glycogen debranching protein GlgX n=1 Tax=Amycolatopsis vancoresmycina DSM 44592 TaxID=1292037 RepID=R1G9V2_9PSEU|nr:alpha-amylase family glycosyl hydrolase [Amycolatopsis vancoresmycina]EOD68143.1 glycogen debranching protein GlgX [Amycolatopsis vancoresmycina DSM 44592]